MYYCYYYQIMKQHCRYSPKLLILPTIAMYIIIEAMTVTHTNPWVKLFVMFASMMIIAVTTFKSKLRSILFYCLIHCGHSGLGDNTYGSRYAAESGNSAGTA